MEKYRIKSHWANAVFTDSEYSVTARHIAFGFEMTDLHNLLNFQDNEDKIPALKFTVQVIN